MGLVKLVLLIWLNENLRFCIKSICFRINIHTLKTSLRRLPRESYLISMRKLRDFYEKVTEFLKEDKFCLLIECFPIVLKCINIELPQKVSLMKSSFCIDWQTKSTLLKAKYKQALMTDWGLIYSKSRKNAFQVCVAGKKQSCSLFP